MVTHIFVNFYVDYCNVQGWDAIWKLQLIQNSGVDRAVIHVGNRFLVSCQVQLKVLVVIYKTLLGIFI